MKMAQAHRAVAILAIFVAHAYVMEPCAPLTDAEKDKVQGHIDNPIESDPG